MMNWFRQCLRRYLSLFESDQRRVAREFSESWDYIEKFYEGFHDWEWMKPIRKFIKALRKRGYDRQLRAGQSLWIFKLSRSREHGLRLDQPSIAFDVRKTGGMLVTYYEKPDVIEIKVDSVEVTPEIEDLLARLLSHPID